jgi:hypothetical protein
MSNFDVDVLRASLQREQREHVAAVQKQRKSEKSRNHWREQAEALQLEVLDLRGKVGEISKNTMPKMADIIKGLTDAQLIEELKRRLWRKKK